MPHRRRASHDRHAPAHVTLRAAAGVPSLRNARVFPAVRAALAASSGRTFRLLQFSVQRDHLHLVVEADGGAALSRGCQGLAVRVAKAVNRLLGRRGAVWGDRYHARRLGTPAEVRRALVYVLQNWRKHVPGARRGSTAGAGPRLRRPAPPRCGGRAPGSGASAGCVMAPSTRWNGPGARSIDARAAASTRRGAS